MKPEIIGKGNLKSKAGREAKTDVGVRYGLFHQLVAMRQERGWSQAELAKRLNTTSSSISRLESQWYLPSTTTLIKLAKIFDVDLCVRFVSFDDGKRIGKLPLNPKSYK